ncbi:MAG: hypothetical protein ACN4GT_02985 [Gammaproteobacteria bacterium]
MSKNEDKKPETNDDSNAASLLNNAYKAGMGAAETMHRTAVEIPLGILEQLGLEQSKVTALRSKSKELLDELYGAIDTVASKSGVVGKQLKDDDAK